jgi:hypothetical protein
MTPALVALYLGLAASSGMGYAPVGPAAVVVVQRPSLDVRAAFDATPKANSGRGWNASLEAVGGTRVLAGARVVVWSGGPWTKAAAGLVAGVRIAPGVRVLAEATLGQSHQWGAWSRSLGIDVEQGRVRAAVKLVRYTQAETRVGVSADISVAVWRRR